MTFAFSVTKKPKVAGQIDQYSRTGESPRRSEVMHSGHRPLQNGLGPVAAENSGRRKPGGARSKLTSVRHRDCLAAAPWQTHLLARLEPIA
jgi:hypothetical protein